MKTIKIKVDPTLWLDNKGLIRCDLFVQDSSLAMKTTLEEMIHELISCNQIGDTMRLETKGELIVALRSLKKDISRSIKLIESLEDYEPLIY